MRRTNRLSRLTLSILGVICLGGCFVALGDVPEMVRRITYPPDFRYLERDEIRGAMWQLALHSRELNRVMHDDAGPDAHRDEILAHLRNMEAAAAGLESGGKPTNHPLLESHVPRLQADVKAARLAVERDPPNYYLAATVAGTCLPCHGGRG